MSGAPGSIRRSTVSGVDGMSLIEYSNTCPTCGGTGWEAATDMGEATTEPCATCDGDGRVVGVKQLEGTVRLTDEQWARVLGWLHMPVPPGPAKALDESIIRAINEQRGQ